LRNIDVLNVPLAVLGEDEQEMKEKERLGDERARKV
jgi:hypothetical protein